MPEMDWLRAERRERDRIGPEAAIPVGKTGSGPWIREMGRQGTERRFCVYVKNGNEPKLAGSGKKDAPSLEGYRRRSWNPKRVKDLIASARRHRADRRR